MSIDVLLGRRRLPRVVLVLFAAALPFVGALGGGFLEWDDRLLLVDNPNWLGDGAWRWIFCDSAGGAFGPYMPLTWVSYRLDHALFGLDARAFLIGNLVIHALAAVALLVVAGRLLPLCAPALAKRPRLLRAAAVVTALLWALHPLRVEAVCWIAQRREVLSGALFLVSVGCWLKHATLARPWWRSGAYGTSLVLFAAAMLAKATPMGWPFVLLLLDVWPLRRRISRATVLEKAPFAAVSALVAAAAWWGQTDTGALADVGLSGRLVLGAHGAALLVAKTLLPVGLHTHYLRPVPFDADATAFLVPALLAGLGTACVFAAARRTPALALSWAAALILVAPVSGLVPIGSHAFADRYTYLPAVPLTLFAVGAGAHLLAARPRLFAGASALLVLAVGVVSTGLAPLWRDSVLLFERVERLAPDNWLAQEMLGVLASERGEPRRALPHFEKAVHLHPSADALVRLGSARGSGGDLVGAERDLRSALAADALNARAHYNLAVLLVRTGRDLEARRHLARTLELAPDYEAARDLARSLGDLR